ncbi:MAG: DUF4091 domain-containing protein, partial [Cyclobacteriaceae bacterium]|nr:DUF4091 domain-containing protein [Cyclobacteriaceae bacterium]
MGFLSVSAFIALIVLSGSSIGEIDEIMVFKTVDPLEKIFKETSFFNEKEAGAFVARGEHASFQFVVRSRLNISGLKLEVGDLKNGHNVLSDIRVGYVDYVRIGRNTPNASRDKLFSVNGLYPDPIVERPGMDISADETQPVWVTVRIPGETPAGKYTGEVILSGKAGEETFEVKKSVWIQVYPVTIKHTSLWVTNWYTTSPHNLELIFGEKNIEPYSGRYWTFIKLLADKMAEYRQNVALISPLMLTEYNLDRQGNYQFDFSRFDQTVEIFREAGVLGRIEGGHLGTREGGWVSDFVVFVPRVEKDTTYFRKLSISTDSAQNFYSRFIPALTGHLKKKGWDQIYMQHLMDEPIPENIDTYTEVAKFIKNLAPELKIVEACHSKDLDNTVNIWVPQLDYMHQDYDFYKARADAGDEIWFYTCLNPKGEYANRFIELPLIKTRILHWINYRYQIPGYLHWGFDFWRGDPYEETTSIQTEGGTILPGGDAWIVYPGDGVIHSSIRLEAMRDGIVDYELLKMLGEKKPEVAAEIARQVIYQFDYYDINIEAFREKRKMILEMLSE